MDIKKGLFAVGIDDCAYNKDQTTSEVFFVFCRGAFLEHLLHASIEIDGLNATEVFIKTLELKQNLFRFIVTHGITVGGFNPVDIKKISEYFNVPVIAVTENKPKGSFFEAIKNLPDYDFRKSILESAGELKSFKTSLGKNKLYYHHIGIDEESARDFLHLFAIRTRLPEQVFLAHRIATGWNDQI